MSAATEQRRILIDAVNGKFAVSIDPPHDDQSFDREFVTFREARGWAGGVRLSRGGVIVDRTCGPDAPANQPS